MVADCTVSHAGKSATGLLPGYASDHNHSAILCSMQQSRLSHKHVTSQFIALPWFLALVFDVHSMRHTAVWFDQGWVW